MESEASWAMLALALGMVLALAAVVVWLSVTEVRAVRPVPAVRRPGRVSLRPGPGPGAGAGQQNAEGRE
jgi:uncharacterized membrane protein